MNDNDRGPHDASELTALRDRVAQLEQALVDHRQQLEKLRHSEEYARLLFEHAPDGYYVCDLQGTFIDGNRAAEQIVGYPRQELIGESFLKLRLLSRQEIVKAGRLLLHSARGLATGPELFTLNRKDGTQATVEIRTHPIRIEGRVRILGIARDITHHKELEAALTRAEERYTLAVSAGRVGVWDWDLETNDIYLDPVLKSMLGFEANEIRNHMDDWSQRVHPEDMELVMAEVTAHLEGRKPLFEVEHRMVCKDGGIRWYLARGSAFHDLDGKPYRVVGTDTDITERREMEAALQRAHDGLEGQVAERTAELAAANRKLEQEIQQRHRMEHELVQTQRLRAMSEMSRGISHNLNNILMGISGPAALLHQDAGESEQAEWSQMILDSIQRATDIVARLDSALRIATSEVVGSVDANAVIRDTLEASMPLWRDEAHVRGIDIHVDTDLQEVPDIRGTDSALADVVMNLLLNAVDAMPEGGRIQVASARFDDAVRVSVCDTGIGMDEATTRRVFEPLFTTNHDVGRGLGLSVAYGTVTRWGGSIGIESRPREGTTVTVDLPIWVEDSDATSLDGPRDTGQRRKVLVVDDEEAIVRTLGRWLGRDHDVQTALNGQQALQGFDEGIFDAALVDLGMAGQRGDWVAREMKERDPAIVTVLMTGWRLREDDPRLHSFDLRIDKPIVRLAELQKVLDQAFALHDERVASP